MSIKGFLRNYIPVKMMAEIKKAQNDKRKVIPATLEPEMYNRNGERIRSFYLCDSNAYPEYSFTQGRIPNEIFWDRTRKQLPIHFYTDDMIFYKGIDGNRRYAILLEPETLKKNLHNKIMESVSYMNEFDKVFTHSERILDKYPNALPIIVGGVYVNTEYGGYFEPSSLKTHNISFVSSAKRMSELHKKRFYLAIHYKNSDMVDTFGDFDGGEKVKIIDSLQKYRYSIAIENYIEPYWITERICNCFATKTVPIYFGSPNIGKYFNMDGIVVLEKLDCDYVDKVLRRCSEDDYLQRIKAVEDNYERVKSFLCMEDWLYNQYSDILKV